MRKFSRVALASAVLACGSLLTGIGAGATAIAHAGSLYQHLTISWSGGHWQNHDRASFQIPGVGSGDIMCSPNTTWIQMTPSDRDAENDMWSVKFQKKDGVEQTAVKEARVYRFSTPTSTIPHGTGASTYEGFNKDTPIEHSDSGTMVALISRRAALNERGGTGSVPTSVKLSWAWSGFHTGAGKCNITARIITPIDGKSRVVSEGRKSNPPKQPLGAVGSFNLNWNGESDYELSTRVPHTISIPRIGTLTGVCQIGTDGEAYVSLSALKGSSPFAQITTYQGEGVDNSTVYDYYSEAGVLGPIELPVNGFIVGELLPSYDAPASQESEIVISSFRKTNDPNPANDYCQVAVQSISAPDPVL